MCQYVAIMYVESSKGKYKRHLLRESYRQGKKVLHRTVGNLSGCDPEEIEAIKLALRYKKDLPEMLRRTESVTLEQGLSIGAVGVLYELSKKLGIKKALGNTEEGKRALWQVIARVIDQGSRLSAVRLAGSHAACDIIGLKNFNEDDLYHNLDWLCKHQTRIENELFESISVKGKKPGLFLYDVTSSYLEGTCNAFAAFGYNRDGKKWKKQIVIGLLCSEEGIPVSIEVFPGNTQDTKTFASQVKKAAERFGGGEITFVGDRGMVKSTQVEDLLEHGFHYITAITKPQIESLLAQNVLQMSFFEQELAEIQTDEGIRYILKRNPVRAMEVRNTRNSKFNTIQREVRNQNHYLAKHPRAHIDVAVKKVTSKCNRLKISDWIHIEASGRTISLTRNEDAFAEQSKLDGCYVLKTDLKPEVAGKELIHTRYRDLSLVEHVFRTSKTVELEIRPVHVRNPEHTRAHAFTVMLAYRLVHQLQESWCAIDLTVQEAINELSSLCSTTMLVNGKPQCNLIPTPRPKIKKLLHAAQVTLPEVLPCKGIKVATRKKLPENRKKPQVLRI